MAHTAWRGRSLVGVQLLVATSNGTDGIPGRDVTRLAADESGQVWAIVDGKEIWRRPAAGDWALVASWDGPALNCLSSEGPQLIVGTVGAHVLRLLDSTLVEDESFDDLPERRTWYTPWGGPPDTRSVATSGETALVNIHVGGVARSNGGGPWTALVDIDVDVHQIAVGPDGSLLVATGAAGFGRSADGGQTWRFDHDGLHASYCRAVAVSGDQVLLSASTGPGRTRGAIYRRPLGASGEWERVTDLVSGNIDTFWLAGFSDGAAAYLTQDGGVWRSADAGGSWDRIDKVAGTPRAAVFV
jgi:hypothetical protein